VQHVEQVQQPLRYAPPPAPNPARAAPTYPETKG
jgi:hypothetical protein